MEPIVPDDDLLYRRFLALSTVLTEIEADRLGWDDFWPRFADFCELLGGYKKRRFARGALHDLRMTEQAAEAEQPGLALQHLIAAVAQLRWRY